VHIMLIACIDRVVILRVRAIARKQLLLSSRLSHRNFVHLSVCLSLHLSIRLSHGWKEIGPRLDLGTTLLSFVIQIENLVFVY